MTQGQSKVFLVTGNENLRNKDVFLESLVYHQKLKKENPFLINVLPNHNCFSGKPNKTRQEIDLAGLLRLLHGSRYPLHFAGAAASRN